MRISKFVFIALALFSLAPVPALAANHTVLVGQNNAGANALAFNPSPLTITAGDTVTFTNTGGLHNVASTGGPTTFRCSVDCMNNNAPNNVIWSDTVAFPTAGTVTYKCEQHGNFGMTGTINVQAVTPVKLQSFDVN